MCVKEGIQCSNPYGVHLKDQYTDYIMECKDHILSKPVMLDSIHSSLSLILFTSESGLLPRPNLQE